MVKHRYQLLDGGQGRYRAHDYITKALQLIVYGVILCLLILHYGYQDVYPAPKWHDVQNDSLLGTTTAQEKQREIFVLSTLVTLKPTSSFTQSPSPLASPSALLVSLSSPTPSPLPLSSPSSSAPSSLNTTEAPTTTTTNALNDSIYATYYVHSRQCRMPRVDPFTPEMSKRFKPMAAAQCSKDESLLHVTFNSTTRLYTLHMNATAIARRQTKTEIVTCCYKEVVRSGGNGAYADMKATLLSCTNFLQDFVVPVHIEAMLVTCSVRKKAATGKAAKKKAPTIVTKVLQEDAFTFVQYKNLTNDTTASSTTLGQDSASTAVMPSVLLIGIDSLSRFNFRRNMPKTFEFLSARKWFELEGYNKMADNTYPNLMALLTGYNQSVAYSSCKPTLVSGLDNCAFIWKHFKTAGYRTAYAEDIASISTFNYHKKGFRQPPTDYYPRPLMLAVERHLKVERKARLPFCVGRRQYGEYVYDYAQQFAECYRDEPTFGLFWTNSFSHNSYDVPSSMDVRMRRYFDDFERSGVLNTTIVFFFSDHGMRFGSVLEMPEGFLEERLPMFFIGLPPKFQDAHPQLVQSLQRNRNRLTTPFDIHMTLIHLLQLAQRPQLASLHLDQYRADGCAHCQSVLLDVPTDRGCEDVGIPEHWCTCVPYATRHPKDKLVQRIASSVVEHINAFVAKTRSKGADQCMPLTLKKVLTAEQRIDETILLNDSKNSTASSNSTYRIKFIVNPKAASFHATATYNERTRVVSVPNVDDISRLNAYADDSKCVNDGNLKKYCICKST